MTSRPSPPSCRARAGRFAALALCTALLTAALRGPADAQSAYGYDDLEAVMIAKIIPFISWPRSGRQWFRITVLGRPALHRRLATLYRNQQVDGRPVAVQRIERPDDVGPGDVLFIDGAMGPELPAILSRAHARRTLTIADTPGYGSRGVAVNLYRDGRRLRFEINRRALSRAGLTASYRLLSLARLVGGEPP